MKIKTFQLSLLPGLLLCLVLCACGGESPRHYEVPAGLAPADVPEGITPELWQELSAELSRVLAKQGTAKRASQVPTTDASKVLDFGIHWESSPDYTLRWTYRNSGDYDSNGLVTIADLTPIGIHFGAKFGDLDWFNAQRADGDNNGEVNIADVTPIGVNFNGRVDGYVLQQYSKVTETWADEELIPLSAIQPNGPPGMSFFWDNAPVALSDLRVCPYISTGAEMEYGIPSNPYERNIGLPTHWMMLRANPHLNANSTTLGPSTADSVVEIPLQGQYNEPCTPISDSNGIVFACSLTNSEDLLALDNETFLSAVSPQGQLLWTRRLPGAVLTTPCVNLAGLVIVATTQKNVYAFTAEGKLYWQRSMDGQPIYGGVLLDFTGASYIMGTHELDGDAILNKLSVAGAALYTKNYAHPVNHPIFSSGNGGVFALQDNGVLRSYTYDGQFFVDGNVLGVNDRNFIDPCVFYDQQENAGQIIVPLILPSELQMFGEDGGQDASYVPQGEIIAGASANRSGEILLGVRETSPERFKLRKVAPDGSELMNRNLLGRPLHYIATDREDRMYYCLRVDEEDGTYSSEVICLGTNQTVLWSLEYDGRVAYAPAITSLGQLSFLLADIEDPDNFSLVMVSD